MKKFIGSLFIFIILLHTAVFADNYNDEIWQDLAYEREMNFSKLANLDESDVQIFKYEKTEEDSKKDENWQSGHIIMKTRLSAYGTFSLFNEILNKSCYNPMNNKNYNYNNYRKRISTFFRRVDLKGENAVGYYRVSFKGNSKKNGTENSYNTFEDYVIARQDKNIEEKWLKKKCKKAKEQIKGTISYIKTEKVSFVNATGKRTMINSDAEIVPLVVFENKSICKYEHLLRSHSNDGLTVNCMSLDDFKYMCRQLLSPLEIIEYIKWRKELYNKSGSIDLLVTETHKGFLLSKPQKNEMLVQQYLYEQYGEAVLSEDKLYYELFRQYVLVLYEHKEIESVINGGYEVIKFLAHLFRDEIKCFVGRTEKALLIAKSKRFEIVGTLRNVKKEYAIVFTATEQGEQIPSEKLLSVVFDKQKVNTLLQVITYWINDDEYRIDFVLWLDGY